MAMPLKVVTQWSRDDTQKTGLAVEATEQVRGLGLEPLGRRRRRGGERVTPKKSRGVTLPAFPRAARTLARTHRAQASTEERLKRGRGGKVRSRTIAYE